MGGRRTCGRQATIIISLVCLALGLLIGGLIGHFGTTVESSTSGGSSDPAGQSGGDKPKPVDEASIRKQLLELFNADLIHENLKRVAKDPHLAGSVENNELADWIDEEWIKQGLQTKKVFYDVLLSYPGEEGNRNFARINNGNDSEFYKCQEEEKILDDQQKNATVVPPFNAYAKKGTVKSNKVYYANYGRIEDFRYLTENMSIDLNGSIVICRYGKIFRGSKVKFAQQFGSLGVILYNDPMDYVVGVNPAYNETFPNSWFLPPSGVQRGGTLTEKGDPLTPGFPAKAGVILFNDPIDYVYGVNATYNETFPHSWFLPPSGAQRGSVMEGNGDPLTVGFPAKDYAYRKSPEQVREDKIMPDIPTQPMGYYDAAFFMAELAATSGSEVQDSWRGGMDITYKYGGELPNNRTIEIVNNNREERRNITNVFGYIPGSEEPDRYIVVGNHRDAWMFGSTDPGSGTSIMMEMSRVMGQLYKEGKWKPRRTIVFASWGGEEYGIIGSWEWCDEARAILTERAIAYLNCDSGVVYNQTLVIKSSPLLFRAAYDAAKQVNHPEPKEGIKTLYDSWLAHTRTKKSTATMPHIGDLGSGSDHTGFLHKNGITSLDMYYHYNSDLLPLGDYYPLYHTTYETISVVEKFVDPNFVYHKALGQLWTEITRNLADNMVIPFKTINYSKRLKEVYEVVNDNTRTKLNQKNLGEYLDYLSRAIDTFSEKAADFDARVAAMSSPKWNELRTVNDQLLQLEKAFLYPLGILDRKYIRHVVFAPSATDAYASSAFPGIGDSLFNIKDDDADAWERVAEELTKAVYAVESAAKSLDKVTDAF